MAQLTASKLSAPVTPRLADDGAERVRREHDQKIVEIQKQPAMALTVIQNVSLVNGASTPVHHGLGRAPSWIKESTVRGAVTAGYIVEVRDGSQDRTKVVLLQANGFGATISVDLAVM